MTAVILDRLIRVGIVDDNELVRRTLHTMLDCSPKLRVVAEAADGSAGLSLVELMQPDVVVMDISMPDMDGIEATRTITSRFPETKVVVLTMQNDDSVSSEAALQAGACRFLTKDCGRESLINAITECAPGPTRVVGNPPH
jgi:DNA-binding NarL/FixJ family response regulator